MDILNSIGGYALGILGAGLAAFMAGATDSSSSTVFATTGKGTREEAMTGTSVTSRTGTTMPTKRQKKKKLTGYSTRFARTDMPV